MSCSVMKKTVFFVLLVVSPVFAGGYEVLPESEAPMILKQCSREVPVVEGTWLPPLPVLEDLEANLYKLEELESVACCGYGRLEKKVDEYFRQYAGIITGGEQLVYINASPGGGQNSKPVIKVVCDGGKNYWGAVYHPVTNEFSHLAFNGES